MRILLINPPRNNELLGNNPAIIDDERGHNPPLGLLYLAAYLERFTDHQVEVLDAQVEEADYDTVREEIDRRKPDVAGITAMTFTLIDVLQTARLVKALDPSTQVVVGGPHVHLYPEETLAFPEVDYLVLGEGEVPFAQLLERIGDPKALAQVGGIAFKHDNHMTVTGIRDLEPDLDGLPFPARHLTPYKKYSSVIAKRSPITTMFTSRGCPYKCIFCDRPHLGKQFRARSARNIVNEIEDCERLGIREFLIYDDTFTIQRQRVIDICDEIIRRKLEIGWDIRARVNTVDREMLHRLREANCERIHYGVESGTERGAQGPAERHHPGAGHARVQDDEGSGYLNTRLLHDRRSDGNTRGDAADDRVRQEPGTRLRPYHDRHTFPPARSSTSWGWNRDDLPTISGGSLPSTRRRISSRSIGKRTCRDRNCRN